MTMDWMIRACSRCNASAAPVVTGIVVFALAASGAGPAAKHSAVTMTVLRDVAAVLLVLAGYGLPWLAARLMSREPAFARRARREARYVPPPPPGYDHVPDVRNIPAEKVPLPPQAPAVRHRAIRYADEVRPAVPLPARTQAAEGEAVR